MRKDARANRAALIDSATRLIAEKGPEVSLREIARDAEVGVATANRNFPDRSALITAIVDHGIAQLDATLHHHDKDWENDPWTAWRATLHSVRELDLGALVEALIQNREFPIDSLGTAEQRRDRVRDLITHVYERGVKHGFVSPDISPIRFYLGLVAASRALPAPAQDMDPGVREWLTDTYIDGLRAQV